MVICEKGVQTFRFEPLLAIHGITGREYAISEPYGATNDGIFDIFRILKGLKQIVTELVEQENG